MFVTLTVSLGEIAVRLGCVCIRELIGHDYIQHLMRSHLSLKG